MKMSRFISIFLLVIAANPSICNPFAGRENQSFQRGSNNGVLAHGYTLCFEVEFSILLSTFLIRLLRQRFLLNYLNLIDFIIDFFHKQYYHQYHNVK